MATANLAQAINAFYRQNPSFPKPDPASNESSMVGMDPSAAGMGQGDILFGQLSPLHLITLDSETKAAANIPASATTFAWAYPMVLEAGQQKPRGLAEASFIEYGGYIYFNDNRDVVGTNSINPAPLGTLGLMFGRPQRLPDHVADVMTKQGRFQEITLKPLADKGATHFGWIRPGEFAMDIASVDGCFSYKFNDGSLKYFPVVSKPVFTKEMAEEELDESEAWVVVENPAQVPTIEIPVIFDRTKTLWENLFNNSHGIEISGSFSSVRVHRNGKPTAQIVSYEDWARSSEPGTVGDPWMFRLERDEALPELCLDY